MQLGINFDLIDVDYPMIELNIPSGSSEHESTIQKTQPEEAFIEMKQVNAEYKVIKKEEFFEYHKMKTKEPAVSQRINRFKEGNFKS